MTVISNPLLLKKKAAAEAEAYQIEKSLRFNSADTAYLSRTPSLEGNRRIWTWSGWIKKPKQETYSVIFSRTTDASNRFVLSMYNGTLYLYSTHSADINISSQGIFRDNTAWYHLVFVLDTTANPDTERGKIYVNGKKIPVTHTWKPALNEELPVNSTDEHRIGQDPGMASETFNGYIADVQFIDGIALSPAAFGSFDKTGAWNPKAFALPAPNKGVTHSSTLTCTRDGSSVGFNSGNPATLAFNGIAENGVQNWANVLSTAAGQVVKMTYTPATAIAAPTTLRIHTYTGDSGDQVWVTFNGKGRTKSLVDLGYSTGQSQWVDVSDILPKGEDITSITVDRTSNSAGDGSPIGGIEVDGILLIDDKTDVATSVNDGTTWSSGSLTGTSNTIHPVEDCFNSNPTEGWMTGALSGETGTISQTLTLPNSVSVQSEMVIWMSGQSNNGNNADSEVILGGHTLTDDDFTLDGTFHPVRVTGSRTISTIVNKRVAVTGSYNGWIIGAIFVDGQQLVDGVTTVYGRNGYHLKLNDTSRLANIGKDSAHGKIADATGGLPIYNTTDDYGEVKATSNIYRDDSSAGTTADTGLILAIPGDAIADESDHINTNNTAATVTANGNAAVATDESRLYGSSIKFDGDGDYLAVTPNTDFAFGTGDFTIEMWIYFNNSTKSVATDNQGIFGIGSYNSGCYIRAGESGNGTMFKMFLNGGSASNYVVTPNNVVKAKQWMHLAFVRSSNVVTIYVNGVSKASETRNTDLPTGNVYIGRANHTTGEPLDGRVNDVRVYKGVAKYTSNFIPPTRNDWAATNLSITAGTGNDSLTDSPTNYGTDTGAGGEVRGNYATWNTLTNGVTLANGNLDASSGTNKRVTSDFALTSGKWYWEYTLTSNTVQQFGLGSLATANTTGSAPGDSGHNSYIILTNGSYYHNGSQAGSGLPTLTTNDVVGVAFDADSRKLWFSKNGDWMASGNPADGTNPLWTVSASYAPYAPTVGAGGADAVNCAFNAGQRLFEDTAPSGFKALCTANLPDTFSGSNLNNPSKFFDIATFTGTGGTITRSHYSFKPDLVWFKGRSDDGDGHELYDAVRGTTKGLYSHLTNGEGTESNGLTAFTDNGFTTGSGGWVNTSGDTYAAWAWDAGTSEGSPKSGATGQTITASDSWYNQDAGFEILKWSGTGTAGKIGHNLGAPPEFLIIKQTTAHGTSGVGDGNWIVGHDGLGAGNGRLIFNGNHGWDSGNDSAAHWNDVTPTNELFGLGTSGNVNGSGGTYIGYIWKSVAGYSKAGTWDGNSSADGPYVHCGFRPKYIIWKPKSSGSDWVIYDDERSPDNALNLYLLGNTTADEGDVVGLDFLSNGFKLRTNTTHNNTTGTQVIFMAFAEHPFKTSRAR